MAIKLSEWQGKRLHFVGIGGAGMSGLARIALSHGISVSGSDAKDSTVLSALAALGAEVHAAHWSWLYTILVFNKLICIII